MKIYILKVLFVILHCCIFSFEAHGLPVLEVHFIDIGQGDSILIKIPSNRNILIDTGNLSTAFKLKKYLIKNQKIDHLDALIITHMHYDHVGGLFSLVPEIAIGTIYDNGIDLNGNNCWEEYINFVRNAGLKRKILRKGSMVINESVVLKVLAPSKQIIQDINSDSIVLKLLYGENSFLLTGDLNKKGENLLLKGNLDIQSQVLKIGHHGACDATSITFFEKVNPEIAIISVGVNNRFGYPCIKLINDINEKIKKLYRTDLHGTIIIKSNGKKLEIETIK